MYIFENVSVRRWELISVHEQRSLAENLTWAIIVKNITECMNGNTENLEIVGQCSMRQNTRVKGLNYWLVFLLFSLHVSVERLSFSFYIFPIFLIMVQIWIIHFPNIAKRFELERSWYKLFPGLSHLFIGNSPHSCVW